MGFETNAQREAAIVAAMLDMRRLGLPIRADNWGVTWREKINKWDTRGDAQTGHACALGCLLLRHNPTAVAPPCEGSICDPADTAAEFLGVDGDWIDDFIRGFDSNWTLTNVPDVLTECDAFRMGIAIRVSFRIQPANVFDNDADPGGNGSAAVDPPDDDDPDRLDDDPDDDEGNDSIPS